MDKCLKVTASFKPTSIGFLELVRWFLRWGGDSFFNQIKKCWLHPGKISVAWYVSSDHFVQECSVATSLLSLQYPGQDPWIPSPSGRWGWGDGDAGWVGAGFCCLLCLENIKYNKKLNSIKTKKNPQMIYQLLLMCSCHL